MNDFTLDGDPILTFGRRVKVRELEGFLVPLGGNATDELRSIARSTIDVIGERSPIEWRPNVVVDAGQYAVIETDHGQENWAGVGADPVTGRIAEPEGILGSELLRIIRSVGDLDELTPAMLRSGDLKFYSITWPSGCNGGPVSFVSEYNPVSLHRNAKSFYSFDGSLDPINAPDVALNDVAELVIVDDAIWMLKPLAFDRLFADVRASLNDVEAGVVALRNAFPRLPFSDISLKAIRSVCASRPTYARRLQMLGESEQTRAITPALLKRALERHGADPHDFIRAGTVEIDRDEVGELLDVLEGRWYEADFSQEPRRADRWTRRSSRVTSPAERMAPG